MRQANGSKRRTAVHVSDLPNSELNNARGLRKPSRFGGGVTTPRAKNGAPSASPTLLSSNAQGSTSA